MIPSCIMWSISALALRHLSGASGRQRKRTVNHDVVLDLVLGLGGLVDWLGQSQEFLQDVLEDAGPGKNCVN